ncbi:MAG: hypothetical protein J5895_04485 [Alphaproteobacteria bacterium]|nr:hypothetical protein [Alphaproteobacteria bacterium]
MSDEINQKIEKELEKYIEFKKKFEFIFKDIIKEENIEYCDGLPIYDEDGKYIPECNKWLNVGYKIKGSLSKLLSNLYPYEFIFRGFHLKSIEAFFQGIKFKDSVVQQMVFNYSGTDAYHIQAASNYDWKETGYVYWQGQAIKRDSSEYDVLVDEVYISAAQNPLYRQALKNITKPIIHSIGKTSKSETVFTRYEFEREINSLSAFLKQTNQNR